MPVGNGDHFATIDDLDARATLRLPERELVLVEVVPTVEVRELDTAALEQLDDRAFLGGLR